MTLSDVTPSRPVRDRERRGGQQREELARRRRTASALHLLPGPVVGGVLAAGFGVKEDTPVESGILAFLVLLLAVALPARRTDWSRLLPLMGVIARGVFPVLGGLALAAVEGLTGLMGL